MPTPIEFTLLYDGACPICQKEVAWLRWKNRQGKLGLQDITAADFDPARFDKTMPELMEQIHGFYPDGELITGMPVFRAAYTAVGLGWLMAATNWPLFRPLFDALYAWFARRRIHLGRFMRTTSCSTHTCNR